MGWQGLSENRKNNYKNTFIKWTPHQKQFATSENRLRISVLLLYIPDGTQKSPVF